MIPDSLIPVANHLWQSTLFAGAAWLLTLALRNNHARVRHRVWVAASFKFLVPFSLLIVLGSHIQWRQASAAGRSSVPLVMEQFGQPFTATTVSSPLLATVPVAPNPLPTILFGIWACGFIGISISRWMHWRCIQGVVRAGSPVHLGLPIPAISSPSVFEPGIFGVFRPVLLLPEGIFEHLTPEQWKTVVAHELCHVRRRDNLIGVVQMFVEAVFWFHPLVWWVSKRIFEEREHACDQEVLRMGSEPRVYAQGILKVCELYLESPVACVAGVSGSNLRKRIEGIMRNHAGHTLTGGKRLLLAGAGTFAVAVPVAIGAMNALIIRAPMEATAVPKFEVAAIRVHSFDSAERGGGPLVSGNRFTLTGNFHQLIMYAYDLKSYQVSGGPNWVTRPSKDGDYYDIIAKAEGDRTMTLVRARQALKTLLADRFQLTAHREKKEMPVYALVVGRGGPKFKESPPGTTMAIGKVSLAKVKATFISSPMDMLVRVLSGAADRPVLDQTELPGFYDYKLDFAREPAGGAGESSAPSMFIAVQEQLGLKLVPQKGSIEIFTIDRAERPSEN